jgi:hypothetical protein
MADLMTIILLDFSIIVTMLILAYLSKRLGDALKIRPYYVILYVAALLVGVMCAADVAAKVFSIPLSPIISLSVRCCAGIAALGVCLRYWSWLFTDFFGV